MIIFSSRFRQPFVSVFEQAVFAMSDGRKPHGAGTHGEVRIYLRGAETGEGKLKGNPWRGTEIGEEKRKGLQRGWVLSLNRA
jgi:hypothetical protein